MDNHMMLCDIGNTNYNFFCNNQELKIPVTRTPILKENDLNLDCVYYISVNQKAEDKLKDNNYCVNLEQYMQANTNYNIEQLGVDRAFACFGIENGVVIDAGSAITIDFVEEYKHLGGYILPGLESYKKSINSISDKLKYDLNLAVNIEDIPTNTKDAISASLLKSIVTLALSKNKDYTIYTTGGDGKFISRLFENCFYDKHLIFKGMAKIVQDNNLLEEIQ